MNESTLRKAIVGTLSELSNQDRPNENREHWFSDSLQKQFETLGVSVEHREYDLAQLGGHHVKPGQQSGKIDLIVNDGSHFFGCELKAMEYPLSETARKTGGDTVAQLGQDAMRLLLTSRRAEKSSAFVLGGAWIIVLVLPKTPFTFSRSEAAFRAIHNELHLEYLRLARAKNQFVGDWRDSVMLGGIAYLGLNQPFEFVYNETRSNDCYFFEWSKDRSLGAFAAWID